MFGPFPSFWLPSSSGTGFSVGRNATGSITGSNSNYTVGFSGGSCVSGTWIVAVIQDVDTGQATISGGSTWTTATGGSNNPSGYSQNLFYKKCGISEPSTYTITYGGTSKNDSNCVSLLEILVGNATNPDAISTTSNTGTPSSATSSASTDIAVICVAANNSTTGQNTTPSGYTSQGQIQVANGVVYNVTNIATKVNVGSGTISPPAWGTPNITASVLWTLLFKA